MTKVNFNSLPLDHAVADFLKRIIDEGKALNYIGAYTFDRSTKDPNSITIMFYMDEELSQFGKPQLTLVTDETTE